MTQALTKSEEQNLSTHIKPDQTVGEIVVQHPCVRARFEQLGIDYCCGGKMTLAEAVAGAGLEWETVAEELRKTLEQSDENTAATDWNAVPVTALADHILKTHHVFMKEQLPRLDALLAKVQKAHGARHGNMLQKLRRAFNVLRGELEPHLMKEEQILVPAIKGIDAFITGSGPRPVVQCGSVANPIRQMEYEHENAGNLLTEMRSVTDDYLLPEDACASFTALYDGIKAMEADLHEHIHLENNILFPKSVTQEASMFKRKE
jgi:regulator of cell morphogenesis and NO signaling